LRYSYFRCKYIRSLKQGPGLPHFRLKNYYQILGLSNGASVTEIKKAYRTLAKTHHPDVSKNIASEETFIEITEAYEFLSDNLRRAEYDSQNHKISPEELHRRDRAYREWVNSQQEMARKRARTYARQEFDDFANSPIFKTAMVVSRVYDYLFIGIGILMAIVPSLTMIFGEVEEGEDPRPLWHAAIPATLGLFFTVGVYVFLFKARND
jgi:hypothetical protein